MLRFDKNDLFVNKITLNTQRYVFFLCLSVTNLTEFGGKLSKDSIFISVGDDTFTL